MISLIVTVDADSKNFNLLEIDTNLSKVLGKYREPFEIIYATTENYGLLNELKNIVAAQKNRQLVISAPSTNVNTQIHSALNYTDNGDVLLCTLDTRIDVIEKILDKHFDGADLVFVQKKENWFKSIFVGLGKITYQFGLKVLGRGQDLCCDSRVMYLNARSVNTIILNPELSKALRITNPDTYKTTRAITVDQIYANPTKEQNQMNKSFAILGTSSFCYLLALFLMAIIFPIFNSGVYTGWVLLGIVLWIVAGIVAAAFTSRQLYYARLGYPIALDLQGEPVLNIVDYVSYDSEIAKQFNEDGSESERSQAVDQLQKEASKSKKEPKNKKKTASTTEAKKEKTSTKSSKKAESKTTKNKKAQTKKSTKK